jgi:N-acetylneuraminic acid mutarotase
MIGKAYRVACSIIAVLTVFVCSSTGQTPTPRAWLGGSAINNTLLTVGGGTCAGCSGFGGNEVAIVEAYDPVSNSWSTKGSLQGPRFGLTASASNGIVYAIGGTLGFFSTPLSTVEAYDPTSNTWSPKSAMPTSRWKLTSSSVNGIIYAIGGGNSGNQNLSTGVLEAYNPATDTWTAKTSMPTARWGLASAAINSGIYAVGGFTGVPSATLFPVLEVYDTTSDTWSMGATMQTPRMDLAAIAVNGKLYAIGGWDSINQKALQTVEAYDPGTDTWSTKAPMPTARSGLVAEAINGKIYAFGGDDGTDVLSVLEVYDPSNDTWTTPATAPSISVSPNQITFPPTLLNTRSAPVTVTVSNSGRALGNSVTCQLAPKATNNLSGYAHDNIPTSSFSINGQYTGAGSPHFLFYDGHPGFDYRTGDQNADGSLSADVTAGITPVLAAADCTVVCVDTVKKPNLCQEGPGEIKIDHQNGNFTIYLHLGLSAISVATKDKVSRGQQIGMSGSTGSPGGPHLHFEVRKVVLVGKKKQEVPVDPYGWEPVPTITRAP